MFKRIEMLLSKVLVLAMCASLMPNAIAFAGSTSSIQETVANVAQTTGAAATAETTNEAVNISESSGTLSLTTNTNTVTTTSAAVTTGSIVTVDTQAPTVPTNLIATVITSTTCAVSWSASTDNAGVTGYDVYNGTTKIGSTTGDTTFEVTGLMPNTLYSFTVVAKDGASNISEASSTLSVTTNSALEVTTSAAVTTGAAATVDTQAPTVSTNLTASSITSTSCAISWTASTDNVGVTEYDIYNGATKIGSTTGDTTFEVTGLTPNTSYSFTVVAKDAAGNVSEASGILTVKTLAPSITISSNLKLTGDSIYQDITLTSGTLDLNGYKLTVNGSLTQTGGTIFIDGGQLSVVGDYALSNSSYLQMTNSSDYISVGRNFLISNNSSNNLTAGILEIKGNFTQKNGYAYNFAPSGSHKVILDGAGAQTVSFDSTGSYFNILDCSKATEVTIATAIKPPTDIIGTENIKCALNLSGSLKLTKDMSFNNEGDINLTSGTLDLNGHKLTVNGNLVQSGGTIFIDGGQLSVVGDYTLSNSSYLQMTNSSDYISVGRNFLISNNSSNNLTAGILEIKGNFTQKNGYAYNFVPSGSHKVILYGAASFDSADSHFNILVLERSSSTPRVQADYEFNVNTATITRYDGSDTKLVIPGKINGNVVRRIGYHAFYNCNSITSIYILDNITDIDANAFEGYNNIIYVDSDRVKQLLIGSGVSADKIIIKQYTSSSSLFMDSDFDLNPEVQQLISYYDDLYLFADAAYDEGIIDEWEYKALKSECEEEVQKYRQQNEIDGDLISNEDQSLLVDIGLSFIPYIGLALGNSTETAADDTVDAQATKKILDPDNFSVISAALITKSKFDFKYTIYELYDEDTKEVRYVGRTRQSIKARSSQHSAADPDKESLQIRTATRNGGKLENLSYQEARGLEQIVYDEDKLTAESVGKKLLNRIRPIRNGETITEDILAGEKLEGKSAEYIRTALKYLGRIE